MLSAEHTFERANYMLAPPTQDNLDTTFGLMELADRVHQETVVGICSTNNGAGPGVVVGGGAGGWGWERGPGWGVGPGRSWTCLAFMFGLLRVPDADNDNARFTFLVSQAACSRRT